MVIKEVFRKARDILKKAGIESADFEAKCLLKDIFGHVCTFENRQPIFHKL